MMLIQSGRFGSVDDTNTPNTFALQIPAGTVASDLTDFVILVRLKDMSATFWGDCKSDGGDIRVKDNSGNLIPHDLARFDYAGKSGTLFFKSSLLTGSDNNFYIGCGDHTLSVLPVGHTYGRNAVWSDYHRVYDFADNVDRTGAGGTMTLNNTGGFTAVSTSVEVSSNQGIAYDGTYYYGLGLTFLDKYDSLWRKIVSNTNIITKAGLTSPINHSGDGCVVAGELYLPMQEYPASTPDTHYIVVFDTATLNYVRKYAIPSGLKALSSICYNPANNRLYIPDYDDGTVIYKYQLDGTPDGTVSLTKTIPLIQGITIFNGYMYLNSDTDDVIYKFQLDGTYVKQVYNSSGYSTTEMEGLDHTSDSLIMLAISGHSKFVTLKEASTVYPGWLVLPQDGPNGTSDNSYALATGLTKFSTWTMGCNVLTWKSGQGSVLCYCPAGSVLNTDNERMAYRTSSGPEWGLWNPDDTWVTPQSAVPQIDKTYRFVATHNGTTNRKVYVDGINTGTDTTCTQKPGGTGDGLYIGVDNSTWNEPFGGLINYVYLRSGILSADWLAAEATNWNRLGPFYTVPVDDKHQAYDLEHGLDGIAFEPVNTRSTISTRSLDYGSEGGPFIAMNA